MRERTPGVWELRVSLGNDPVTGKLRQRSVTFRGKKRAAQTELNRLVAITADARAPDTESTVRHLLAEWIDHAERDLSPTTAREYRRIIDMRLVPELGHLRMRDVTPRLVDDLYRRLGQPKPKGAGLSPASVMRVHAVLRRAFNQAVRWGWIENSPIGRATPPRQIKAEVEPPAVEDLWRIIDRAREEDPALALLFLVAAGIGARRSELLGLRWRDVDVERGEVRISRGVVDVAGRVIEKDTKTHAARRVELDAMTTAALAELRVIVEANAEAASVRLGPAAFVFSGEPSCRKPLRPERVSKAFARIRDTVGAAPTVRLHDLRHLSASVMLAEGVQITEVSRRLGHAKVSTTLDFYSHLVPGRKGDGPAAIERGLRRPD